MATNIVVHDRVPTPPIHGWLIEGNLCRDIGIHTGFVTDEKYAENVQKVAEVQNKVLNAQINEANSDRRKAVTALDKADTRGDVAEVGKLKVEIEALKNKMENLEAQVIHVVEIVPEWFDMKKTLSTLNTIKKPLYHGWTVDDVVEAMTPYLKVLSRKYATSHCPMEECMTNGLEGIRKALKKDKAIAPFAKYAYRWIQTKIRRPAMTSGVIRHGERDGDLFGNMGATQGWVLSGPMCGMVDLTEGFTPNIEDYKAAVAWNNKIDAHITQVINSPTMTKEEIKAEEAKLESQLIVIEEHSGNYCSIDAPIGDDSRLRDVLEDRQQSHVERTDINEMVHVLLRRADLTTKQHQVVVMLWGLEGHIEMGATDVAKELRISKARVGHISKRGMRKIREAALELNLNDFDRRCLCDILHEEDKKEARKKA